MRRTLPILAMLGFLVAACLTRVKPRKQDQFDRVHWANDYASALALAGTEHKPLLVVMVAGPRDGAC